jgi:hypothetical protein
MLQVILQVLGSEVSVYTSTTSAPLIVLVEILFAFKYSDISIRIIHKLCILMLRSEKLIHTTSYRLPW